jgi:hypothetical protein
LMRCTRASDRAGVQHMHKVAFLIAASPTDAFYSQIGRSARACVLSSGHDGSCPCTCSSAAIGGATACATGSRIGDVDIC